MRFQSGSVAPCSPERCRYEQKEPPRGSLPGHIFEAIERRTIHRQSRSMALPRATWRRTPHTAISALIWISSEELSRQTCRDWSGRPGRSRATGGKTDRSAFRQHFRQGAGAPPVGFRAAPRNDRHKEPEECWTHADDHRRSLRQGAADARHRACLRHHRLGDDADLGPVPGRRHHVLGLRATRAAPA